MKLTNELPHDTKETSVSEERPPTLPGILASSEEPDSSDTGILEEHCGSGEVRVVIHHDSMINIRFQWRVIDRTFLAAFR